MFNNQLREEVENLRQRIGSTYGELREIKRSYAEISHQNAKLLSRLYDTEKAINALLEYFNVELVDIEAHSEIQEKT